MRIESSVTAVTWIPSEAIDGMPKLPFELGVAHYDEPPPDRSRPRQAARRATPSARRTSSAAGSRSKDGEIVDDGSRRPRAHRRDADKVGPGRLAFPAVAFPLIQPEPEIGPGWARFVQTAGGRMGLPAPRRVRGKPYVQIARRPRGRRSSSSSTPTAARRARSSARARSRATGSTTTRASSSRSRGRSTSRSGTASRTARTRRGAARTRPRS